MRLLDYECFVPGQAKCKASNQRLTGNRERFEGGLVVKDPSLLHLRFLAVSQDRLVQLLWSFSIFMVKLDQVGWQNQELVAKLLGVFCLYLAALIQTIH